MKKLVLAAMALVFGLTAYAQIEAPVKWAYAAKKTSPTDAVVLLKASIDKGWHIYSLNLKDGGPVKTSVKFTRSKDFSLLGKTTEPTPVTKFEKSFGMNVTYFENQVVFQQKIKLKAKQTTVKGTLEYMTCNDQKCLPPETLNFSVAVN